MSNNFDYKVLGYISKAEVESVMYQRKGLLPAGDVQKKIFDTWRLTDEFRRSYGEYLFSDDPNRESIRTAVDLIKRYKHLDSVDVETYRDLIIDILYSKYILGFKIAEYFLYDFEHTPIRDRIEFLTENQRDYYYSKLNDSKKQNHILDNKFLAYQTLMPYYGRDVISISASDFETFSAFAKKHPRFILKPVSDNSGHGVSWVECDKKTNLRQLFHSLVENNQKFICEEPVIAPEYMKKMYPHAINTIRIVTYYNGTDEPVVVAALMRVGQGGACVDNFSAGGIIAELDTNTGVITSDGVTKTNYRYEAHPDTGVTFRGFQVEHWDELLTLAKKLPYLLPEVRLIGWDMAASADQGWQIIEGNAHPWLEMHQFCRPHGFKRQVAQVTEWKKHGI